MLDWLTLRLSREHVPPATLDAITSKMGRVTKTASTGEILWCIPARENISSNSHQVTVHVTARHLELTGTPARVLGDNNVFGSGDIRICWAAMVSHVSAQVGVLPLNAGLWSVSRVDITHNYLLRSAAQVRQALNFLRHAEGGRLQVRTASETVYWSPKSRMTSAKAYHKGPHLRYQFSKGQADAEPWQMDAADRLLRLELSKRAEFWSRQMKPWYEWSESDFDQEHDKFFSQVIGKVEVAKMDELLSVCEKVAKTPGQGRAAYRTLLTVRQIGQHMTQGLMPRRTWLHHRKILFSAGLTFADLHGSETGNVIPLIREPIRLDQPVRSWDELRERAAA